jgi:hypothetical protein
VVAVTAKPQPERQGLVVAAQEEIFLVGELLEPQTREAVVVEPSLKGLVALALSLSKYLTT